MSKLGWGIVVWSLVFFAFELPAHFVSACPWPTLSRTVWDSVSWWHPVAYFVAIFTLVLLGHFEFEWSVGWLIGVAAALTLAVVIHLIVR